MTRITKIRNYRLNFCIDGKHYSIQSSGELYEDVLYLRCKEDRDFEHDIYSIHKPLDYVKVRIGKGGCYSHCEIMTEKIESDFKVKLQ